MTNWTIDGVREALASKKVSARELAAEHYTRIAARNPELNAFLALSPERAYAQADRVDAMVATGKPLPPLAGVPMAIKDVISTRGVRTTCGSKILENYVPLTVRCAIRKRRIAFQVARAAAPPRQSRRGWLSRPWEPTREARSASPAPCAAFPQ